MTDIANWKITNFHGKIPLSMVIFHSYVCLPEGLFRGLVEDYELIIANPFWDTAVEQDFSWRIGVLIFGSCHAIADRSWSKI